MLLGDILKVDSKEYVGKLSVKKLCLRAGLLMSFKPILGIIILHRREIHIVA